MAQGRQSLEKIQDLGELYSTLEQNYQELPLATKADDIVPGEGTELAEIMLIGEAPGKDEAIQRRPFVGRSGQLLRKTLVEVGIQPESVFISNIVKVRPPENRDPTPEEILAFKPYLDKEIELIQPKIIITLGRFSMAKFLPDVKVSQVHGRLHKVRWNNATLFVLPMYHPAAALRNPKMKESFLEDFSKVSKIVSWVSKKYHELQYQDLVKELLF